MGGALVSQEFIDALIDSGGPVAKANDLPVAAMVACAVGESGGTSDIYNMTHCPFNMQRPDHYVWVHCQTKLIRTSTKTDSLGRNQQPKYAPFCVAQGSDQSVWLADAVRIWCEWVLGWPNPPARAQLLAVRHNPEAFARSLPLVGFGEADKAGLNGGRFVSALREHNLVERCKHVVARSDGKVSLPIPPWLPGWWVVSWRGQSYYYHFSVTLHVIWTQVPPLTNRVPPLIVTGTGRFIVDTGSTVAIKWGTGTEEKFAIVAGSRSKAMAGRLQGVEELKATRL